MATKVNFEGNFWEYFIVSILLLVASVLTFGLLFPYWIYWNFKYFFTQLEIDDQKITFTGNFFEYFFISLGLLILTVITLGIFLPYYTYWSFKYFFNNLQLERPAMPM